MPISRYEIRNEYSLADPELYRAADKDDPEALLEGVAMAGLVGVLRQLGDLAEFAADIFHNLHEDVMATAARGHTLAVRVQQLETEIPTVERAFLSQIDHSSFFYHPGVDWHPNLQLDKNLVTQGDLPRFIMDSYEECREPPRLFLLDKFDVAGAGACQKRYTDPSFFKVETSEMTSADIQREKKLRKAKKKGPRWRNREPPEVLPTSHTKLHQLFLEERVENGVSTPSRRAKLKRRLNGFPFNSKTGKSYMENLLKSPSPDHKVLHDMTVDSPQLKWTTNDHDESGSDIFEFKPVKPDRERGGRKRSTPSSPDREGFVLNPPMYDSDESPIDDNICEAPSSHPSIATDGISAALDKVADEKVVAVDAESKREGSLTGYESDDIASEIDNYVDAPSTMESEMDRDSDLRMKSDNTSLIKMESLITDAYEEPLHSRSSDSQSTGDSMMSDAGNNSSTKEICSFSSDSPSISAEKPQSESFSTNGFQCTDIHVNERVDASSYQEIADDDFPVDHLSRPVVSDDTCSETDAITNHRSESEQVSSSLCNDGSIPPLMHSDLDEVVRKCTKSDEKVSTLDDEDENTDPVIGPPHMVSDGPCIETNAITNQRSEFEQVTSTLCINGSMSTSELSDPEDVVGDRKVEAPGLDDMVSTLDDKEKKINLVINPTFSPSACISGSQLEDDLSRSSDGEQLVDKPNSKSVSRLSTQHDIYHHTTDSSVKTSSNLLHEDESDAEDWAWEDDATSALNIPYVLPTNGTLDAMSSENLIPGKLEDEVPEVPENSLSDYPDAAHYGDNIEPRRDNLINVLGDEDSNVSTDSPNHFPCIMEASLGKGLKETSLASVGTLNVEDTYSNSSIDRHISLENLKLSHLVNSPDRSMEGLDAHEEEVIPEEETIVNETLPHGDPEPCDFVGLMGTGISYHVFPSDSEALERSHCTSEDLEEPAGTSETVEMKGISPCSDSNAQEVTEIAISADPKPENEIHVLLNKSGLEADTFNTVDFTSPVPAISDDASLSKLEDEYDNFFVDSGIDELKNYNNCPSEGESDLVEKVDPTEASASAFGTIVCTAVDNDHPKSELSGLVPNSHLDLEFDHNLEFVHAATSQSPAEQCGLDREQELFNESGLENDVPDASSLPVDQHFLNPVEISLELSPLSPITVSSLGNSLSPPSIPEFSRLSNNEINVPRYPKDPLSSISPPSNPFLEANQINLSDLPPLPPLPPVQWRMGKFQHDLPSAEEEMIRNEQSFSHLIVPTAPVDDVDSTLSAKSTHDGSSQLTVSTDDINSSCENMKETLTVLAAETTSKEEHLDNSSSSLEAKTLHETTDHPPKIENKPHLLATSKEEHLENSSSSLEAKTLHEATDHPPKIDDKPQLLATSKEEHLENGSSSLESKTLHETTDHPPKIENKPQLLATPISENVSTSSAAEDGTSNGSQKVKWPRPRNPLIDDVSFLDKSKLRKVTERVRPEIQKVDERDSLLEQIRTKSFNLKPAMTSRPSIRDRGPNTNLQVVAILEKANAIRQAFAGSDEDDDSWSE
ncbi:SCAR-like protein 2 [Perilla frutescens var. frutescens]|nr:SCAR-like protein 2 [Perilla frutescens var. frutescens]